MFHENADMRRRSMMGLSYVAQLVVWGIRKSVVQQSLDPDLPAEFQAAFGEDGEEGLRIFCSFFRLLGRAARRPYEIAPPSALLVTQGEQRILTLLGAAQLGAKSDDLALFEAHLLWLASHDHRPALAQISLYFAHFLAAHGHEIAVAQVWPMLESGSAQAPSDEMLQEAVASRPKSARRAIAHSSRDKPVCRDYAG